MERTRDRLRELDSRRSKLRRDKDTRVDAIRQEVTALELWNRGEYEVFGSWRHKLPDAESGSSWSVLAEMQHFGVPTRLLDWSESLPVAIYFAASAGSAEINLDVADVRRDGFRWSDDEPASLWILNPFALSERASGHRRIWDVPSDPGLDYCRRFLIDADWPYSSPLPIYTSHPFRRMEAQRGCFTVWGSDRRPLDEMRSTKYLTEVRLSAAACAVARWMVTSFLGYDRFSLFLDRDSLGAKLSQYVR
jgi:hypothetical protein